MKLDATSPKLVSTGNQTLDAPNSETIIDPSNAKATFRRDPRGIPQITLEFGKASFGVPL